MTEQAYMVEQRKEDREPAGGDERRQWFMNYLQNIARWISE